VVDWLREGLGGPRRRAAAVLLWKLVAGPGEGWNAVFTSGWTNQEAAMPSHAGRFPQDKKGKKDSKHHEIF